MGAGDGRFVQLPKTSSGGYRERASSGLPSDNKRQHPIPDSPFPTPLSRLSRRTLPFLPPIALPQVRFDHSLYFFPSSTSLLLRYSISLASFSIYTPLVFQDLSSCSYSANTGIFFSPLLSLTCSNSIFLFYIGETVVRGSDEVYL